MAKSRSSDRSALKNRLAVMWIKMHRPDVHLEIMREVNKKFPLPTHKNPSLEKLPENLQKLV